jgi:hypothetical protein
MANKYMKKSSTSLVIKKMQIKATLRVHLTPVTCPHSRAITTNADKEWWNRNPYAQLVGMLISTTIMEGRMAIPQTARLNCHMTQ